jgi:hypothetical protein
MKTVNPYDRYTTSTNVLSNFILDEWHCELVEPKHPALRTAATLDPF